MLLFYSLIAVLLLLAIAMLARVLIRSGGHSQAGGAADTAVSIHKHRLAELDNEKSLGMITREQAESARLELERALLDEIGAGQSPPLAKDRPMTIRRDWVNTGVIAILLPVIALSLYYKLGAPTLIPVLNGLEDQSGAGAAAHCASAASLAGIVEALARRLEANPDDVEGLYLLARSYMSMKRFSEAAEVFKRLLELGGDRPDILLPYADALAMANEGRITGAPEELVLRALKIEPEEPTGLWLAGLAAFEQERYEAALEYWNILQPKLTPGTPDAEEIGRQIASANAALGRPDAAAGTEAVPVAASNQAGDGGLSLTVSVEMSPEIAAMAKPEQVVFVYAQAVNGPPMPLAVVQRPVTELPLEITLNDSLAMLPELKLSGFPEVRVSARISASGNATAQSGDFQAEAVQVETSADQSVKLRIDRQVP